MRLALHLLKYELRRLRWYRWLTWLPVLGVIGYYLVPEYEEVKFLRWLDLHDKGWLWSYAAAVLAGMAAGVIAAAMPAMEERTRAFTVTRPIPWRDSAVALGLLLAVLVQPGAVAYGGILAVSGFNVVTVLTGWAQACGILYSWALCLWLWARTGRCWLYVLPAAMLPLVAWLMVVEDFHGVRWWHLPEARYALLPLALCLPALAAWRIPRSRRREAWSLATVFLCPAAYGLLWAVSAAEAYWFPSPLEREVFGRTRVMEMTAEPDLIYRQSNNLTAGTLLTLPAPEITVQGEVLAFSWRPAQSGEWSAWEAVSCEIPPQNGRLAMIVPGSCDIPLHGVNTIDVRLRVVFYLRRPETVRRGLTAPLNESGPGWYVRPNSQYHATRVAYDAAPGFGIEDVEFSKSGLPPGNFYDAPKTAGETALRRFMRWLVDLRGNSNTHGSPDAGVAADIHLVRKSKCFQVVQVNGLAVGPPLPQPSPQAVPVRAQPVKPERVVRARKTLFTWREPDAPVPPADAPEAELAYFAQWLSEARALPANAAQAGALLAAKPEWFIHMAALREPPERYISSKQARPSSVRSTRVPGPILELLIAWLPESQRDNLLRRLWDAPWLGAVVQARCWEDAALPFLIESAGTGKPAPPRLLPLLRSFAHPGFHDVMRRSFRMDVETIDYWFSMPGLREELPDMLDRQLALRSYAADSEVQAAVLRSGYLPALKNAFSRPSRRQFDYHNMQQLQQVLLDTNGQPPPWTAPAKGKRWRTPQDFLDWLSARQAEDFIFDPGRRKFRQHSAPP